MRTRYPLILGGILASALLLAGTALGAARYLTKTALDEGGSFAPGAEQRLLSDLERLHGLGLLAGEGTAQDAAPVLNRLVQSDAPVDGMTPAWWAQPKAFVELESYKAETSWLDHPELTSPLDVSILKQLQAYDHWAWEASDPFRAHFEAHPNELAVTSPIPNYLPFQWLAKVRLAQGYTNGDLPAALAEVEHLAMLIESSHTLVGSMVAKAVLKAEQKAYDRALSEGKIEADPKHRWTDADLEALKSAAFAASAVYVGTTPGEGLNAFAVGLAQRPELSGVCAGIVEGITMTAMTRDVIASPWPLEADLSGPVTTLTQVLAASPCAIPHARAVWARPELGQLWRSSTGDAEFADAQLGETLSNIDYLMQIPYVRQPFAARLQSTLLPNYLGPYGS
jgi:hypothetical protein